MITKTRGFEVVSSYVDRGIHIPDRKTSGSSGYDLEAADYYVLYPHVITVISTGLKAYMNDDEYLSIFIRSSLAFKKGLMLANNTGIIDSDYYNNPDNEGHIMVGLYNTGDEPVAIKKGDRVAQGIFMKYLTCDNDCAQGQRVGGIGSTGK
mgnify:FL=1